MARSGSWWRRAVTSSPSTAATGTWSRSPRSASRSRSARWTSPVPRRAPARCSAWRSSRTTAPSTSWTTLPTPSNSSTRKVVAARFDCSFGWYTPRNCSQRSGRGAADLWSGVQDDEGGYETVRGAAGVAEALGVLDEEDVAGAEDAGLAGRGDLDAAGDADDELALVLGLLGVASAGRAVAEQDRDSLPWLRHAHHVRRRVLGEDGNLDVLEPGVTVGIGVQAGNRHHGAMMTPARRCP